MIFSKLAVLNNHIQYIIVGSSNECSRNTFLLDLTTLSRNVNHCNGYEDCFKKFWRFSGCSPVRDLVDERKHIICYDKVTCDVFRGSFPDKVVMEFESLMGKAPDMAVCSIGSMQRWIRKTRYEFLEDRIFGRILGYRGKNQRGLYIFCLWFSIDFSLS